MDFVNFLLFLNLRTCLAAIESGHQLRRCLVYSQCKGTPLFWVQDICPKKGVNPVLFFFHCFDLELFPFPLSLLMAQGGRLVVENFDLRNEMFGPSHSVSNVSCYISDAILIDFRFAYACFLQCKTSLCSKSIVQIYLRCHYQSFSTAWLSAKAQC